MSQRFSYKTAAPAVYHAISQFERSIDQYDLDPMLRNLVAMRASQINGCTFCLKYHSSEARKLGESEERLYVLDAWRDAPYYSDRERAALALTEAVTTLPNRGVPDDVFDAARQEFGDKGLVELVQAILAINTWNRVNITFRTPPRGA